MWNAVNTQYMKCKTSLADNMEIKNRDSEYFLFMPIVIILLQTALCKRLLVSKNSQHPLHAPHPPKTTTL